MNIWMSYIMEVRFNIYCCNIIMKQYRDLFTYVLMPLYILALLDAIAILMDGTTMKNDKTLTISNTIFDCYCLHLKINVTLILPLSTVDQTMNVGRNKRTRTKPLWKEQLEQLWKLL